MGPVKPDLPVGEMTLILTFTKNYVKSNLVFLETWSSIFICNTSDPWSSSESEVLASIPLWRRPVIRRPEELAADPVIGLPSPGALENPPDVSRALSSAAVTGGARSQVRSQHIGGFLIGDSGRFFWGYIHLHWLENTFDSGR